MKLRTAWSTRVTRGLTAFAGLAILLLSGCAGRPEPAVQNYAQLLYREKGIFLQVKPSENLSLAHKMLSALGMDPAELDTVLTRTRIAYCYFDIGDDGFSYSIIGQGRYPETIAALSLRSNADWQREGSDLGRSAKVRWWSNQLQGVKLSFLQDNTVAITNGSMEELLYRIYYGPAIRLPDEAVERVNSGVLGIYSRNPDFGQQQSAGGAVAILFSKLKEVGMSFTAQENDLFTIDAEYLCSNQTVARSMYLVLRLALINGLRSSEDGYDLSELIGKDPVILQDNQVVLRDYPITLENMDWFFQQALPYIRIDDHIEE
ncbi:MAG: hypothetical protein K9L66_08550 [Spirochaetaceae bacterium]|nr:hypothetical protein [Spirochaetaceae bacterium]